MTLVTQDCVLSLRQPFKAEPRLELTGIRTGTAG
jgi:hypothetical protein